MMPKQSEIEVPLLRCLADMGGRGKPAEIYERIRSFFPNLTDTDLAETLESGGSKWTNRIQWVRQRLVSRGELSNAERGVWAITQKGRERISKDNRDDAEEEEARDTISPPLRLIPLPNLEEVAEEYIEAYRQKALQKLQDITPQQFEKFAGVLLSAYGFLDVRVTGKTGDGGIDGHGKLKVGLATMNVAFQCKRWQGQVGRPVIDQFRGAIQGKFEQGVVFTPSDFSEPARGASLQMGAVPIVLINGDAIVQLMIEKGIGVKRRPVEIYEDQIDALFEDS
jgi:restriction system protein